MHEETKLIVEAINNLKQETNFFKEYAFPIMSAFFSSILGAAIAYFTLRRQEKIEFEKEKMNISNKWTLLIEGARSNLLAIKGNYHGKLGDNPLMRAGMIPTILIHDADTISQELHELSFILPKEKSKDGSYPKWSQIPRVRAMTSNYNQTLELWKQRNILNEKFKAELINKFGPTIFKGYNLQHAIEALGQAFLIAYIDLTEKLIKLTDDLILEMDDFLQNFPVHAKSVIDVKKLKGYGSVLTYSNNDNQALLEMFVRSPEVNFSSFEGLFSESKEEIKKRHETGYENL